MSLRLVFLLAIFVTFTGCTVRGYSGPERPKSEISTITLHRVGEITIENLSIDGREISGFADNVELIPGSHEFYFSYYAEDKEDCHENDILCLTTRTRGTCEGKITTLPGRTYLVTLEYKYSLVDLRIAPKGYFDFFEREDEPNPGWGSCQTTTSGGLFY